jgi:tetratricopeptide (TPR) repeat protein
LKWAPDHLIELALISGGRRPVKTLIYLPLALIFFLDSTPDLYSQERDEITVDTVVDDLKNGKPRLAVKHSLHLSKSERESAVAHALHGLALIDCGEYGKAEKELRIALSLDQESPEAHLGIGKLAWGKGHRGEAIKHFYAATSSAHLKYLAHHLLGYALSLVNEHDEAVKIYEQALNEISGLSDDEEAFLRSNISIYKGFGKKELYRISDDFRSTQVSFTNSDGHILVPVKVNGKDIGSVHLDTGGSGGLTLSAEWANKLNLEIIGRRTGRNVAKELKADVALLDEIRLGDLVIKNVPVNLYEGSAFHGNCSGNLGKEVLQNLNMTLDFKNSEVIFYHPEYPELLKAEIEQKEASQAIPFYNINFIVVTASINGHEAQPFILDTGAGVVVFHEEYYLDVLEPRENKGEKSKLESPKAFTVKSILLGNRIYKDQFSIAMDLGDLYAFGKVYYPGIIGNPLFQEAKVHFNFADSVLIIEEKQ